jgi:amidase
MSISQLYDQQDGLGLAESVKRGDVSAEELLTEALARTEKLNPVLGAVAIQHADYAFDQITRGLPDGPFKGVPFLLKNLIAQLKGTETSNGSRFFQGRIADHNSTVVDRYLKSGVTIFGKTNSPEMGLSGSSDPLIYGPTRNPWNLEMSAGGSSGGAAAAVAARIVPIAHGSDGGGSIRSPASVCGLVGLKPSRARIPSGPYRGESWAGFSSHHVLTRSVRDSAAMLDQTAGAELGDPYQVTAPPRPFLDEVSIAPPPLRIGMGTHRRDGTQADPEVVEAMQNVARLLESLGHKVEDYEPQITLEEIGSIFSTIMMSNVAHSFDLREQELDRKVTEQDVETLTWFMIRNGREISATDYVGAVIRAQQHARQFAAVHDRFDVVLGPTSAVPAMPLGAVNMNGDVAAHTEALRVFVPSISIYNMSGQPSISLPLSWSADGLPIGSMFTAPLGEEALLFRLAGQLEQARPWKNRRPPVISSV